MQSILNIYISTGTGSSLQVTLDGYPIPAPGAAQYEDRDVNAIHSLLFLIGVLIFMFF